MSYIKDSQLTKRRPSTQHISPQEAVRRVNEAVDEANAHVADILARSLTAIELAEAECQQALSEARAEATVQVAHWQGLAEELGEELAQADRRIKALEHELSEAMPKAGNNKRKGRKKRAIWELEG